MELKLKPGAKAAAFKIGSNVIVDSADPVEDKASPAAEPAKPATVADKPAEAVPAAALVSASLHIPVNAPAGIAVFKRGGFLWIASDGNLGSLPVLAGAVTSFLGPPLTLPVTGGTIYRYRLQDAATRVGAAPGKDGWDISFNTPPGTSPGLAIKSEADLNRVRIVVAAPEKPLTVNDPDLGDTILIFPLRAPDARVELSHLYPEANLLATAQGVAILRKSDSLTVVPETNRLLISKVSVLDLVGGSEDTPLFFDLAGWRQGGLTHLWDRRAALQLKAATEADPRLSAMDLIALARTDVANGFGAEALAYLAYIKTLRPELAESPDYIALEGAAATLAGRTETALADFANPQLQTQPELHLWRGLAAASGTPEQQDEALLLLRANARLIGKYPAELQGKFALALTLLALQAEDQPALQDAANILPDVPQTLAIQAAAGVVKASLLAQSPTPEKAIAAYDEAAKTSDPFWRAMASSLAIKAGMRDKTMSAKDAIARLDSLRYMWRGGEMEKQSIFQLGSLYLDQNDYVHGMPVLREVIDLASDTPLAGQAKDKIVEAVKRAFSAEHGDEYSPLDVLAFYDQTIDILPPNTLTPQDMAQLSHRLAEIGLVDRAADFLEPQLKTVQDAQKAQLGAQIAALRLLDDHPDAALKVLAETNSDKASDNLKTERKLLQARAMSKTGKPFEALVMLQGTNGREADALRVDIAWGVQNWKEAAAALGRLVGPVNGQLTEQQSNIILNEAVALSLDKNTDALVQLHQDYGVPMMGTSRGNAFALLTSPNGDMRAPNVDAVKATVSGLDIFQNFLVGYHKPNKA